MKISLYLSLFLSTVLVSGCVMTPSFTAEDASKMTDYQLCETVGYFDGVNSKSIILINELDKRMNKGILTVSQEICGNIANTKRVENQSFMCFWWGCGYNSSPVYAPSKITNTYCNQVGTQTLCTSM